jgi:hypothetical protein
MSKCAVVFAVALFACSGDDRAASPGSTDEPGGPSAASDDPRPDTSPSPSAGGNDGTPASNEATNDALPLAPITPTGDAPAADDEPAAEPVQQPLPELP